mgnify:FL=1
MMQDEPNFYDFQQDKNILEKWLIEVKFKSGAHLLTYKKLEDIEKTAEEYFSKINNKINGFNLLRGVCIDIGAHHGSVSVYAAAMGGDVVAYEPNPINYAILNRNIEKNSDLKIKSYNSAVGAESGNLLFNFGKTSTTGAMVDVGRDWKRTDDTISVNVIGINSILSMYDNVEFLKMDCEGCEYKIFENITDDNLNKVRVFYVEVHPTKENQISDYENIMKNRKIKYFKKEVGHGCYEFICSKLEVFS